MLRDDDVLPMSPGDGMVPLDGTEDRGEAMSSVKKRPSTLAAPKGADPRWREKIELAKSARERANVERRGKPTSFRSLSSGYDQRA